jgi:phospholipase/carboxylesterase
VLILLHGHGARADDLVPLVPVLSVRPGMRFVFPAGPRDLGGGARAWWPLPPRHLREAALASGGRDLAREEPRGMIEARDAVVALLRESSSRFGVEPSEIVIGGFSQGAMMAVDAALHADEPPRGVVSLSGALVAEAEWVPRMTRLARSSVFVSHGRRDTLLPFAGSESLAARLGEAAVPVTFVAFDGDHELPEEVLTRLREHLGEILPATRSAP